MCNYEKLLDLFCTLPTVGRARFVFYKVALLKYDVKVFLFIPHPCHREQPSPSHSASCQPQPWQHRVPFPCRSWPSTCHPRFGQFDLKSDRYVRTAGKGIECYTSQTKTHVPKLASGFSSWTVLR